MNRIGPHMQTNRVNNWPEHIKHMTVGAVFKVVDDIGMCRDAKQANPEILTDVRFWVDWMQQFDNDINSTRARARLFISQWLNASFREAAPFIDMIEDFNEYWAVSHTTEETNMRILWVQQLLWVWNNEILTQPENQGLRHIKWCLGNAAIGNDIPWQVAKMAYDGGHYIGYHAYISIASRDLKAGAQELDDLLEEMADGKYGDGPLYRANMREGDLPYRVTPYYPAGKVANAAFTDDEQEAHPVIPGERSPGEFIWGSGRILQQDIHEYQPRGIFPKYVITEGGPIRDANGHAWLQPNDGWRHKNCENGSLERYLRHTREVFDLYHQWNRDNNNRMIGYTLFTSGANDWKDFILGGGELDVILSEVETWPDDEIAPPPPPPTQYAHGMDFSHHNVEYPTRPFQTAKALAKGVTYAWMKASDGYVIKFAQENQFIDEEFTPSTNSALDANILVGAYHYFAANNTVQAQVDNFLSQIDTVKVQNLPPVLDLEDHPDGNIQEYQARVIEWLEKVEAATGTQPMLYSNKFFYDDYLNQEVINKYPLWIANYTTRDQPLMPNSRQVWTFWQYSADENKLGSEYGLWSTSVDLNRYIGNEGDLAEEYDENWKKGEHDPLIKPTYLREEYERYVIVIPPWATSVEEQFLFDLGRTSRNTFMFSYDDAGATPVENNTAILYDIADSNKQGFTIWFNHWYPKTKVIFGEYPEGLSSMSPEQFDLAIKLTLSNIFTQGE